MSDVQNSEQSSQGQTIIINQSERKPTNGVGTAGFVLALITLFLGWVPVLGWILWALGLILSLVGMFKKPNGLAIAGFVVSLIGLVMLIFVVGAIAALFGMAL